MQPVTTARPESTNRPLSYAVRMLDIRVVRENPELIRSSQLARSEDPAIVDRILDADARRRAAALAFDTGAKIVTAFVRYTKNGITIEFSLPLNVDLSSDRSQEIRRVTQVIADQFEKSIATHPESWHMLQRIFVDENFQARS